MIFVNSAFAQAAAAAVNTPEDTEPGVIANFVYQFFVGVFAGIIRFEGWILVILTRIFIGIAKYNGFVNSPAVVTGWTLVRDVANMFFILVMLAIALGTILHIESYNFKRLLPKVLIMAVLVNFSRTICGLAIDFAQVIMMTFAVGFASIVGAGDLMATLHITEMLNASAHLDKEHSIDWSGAFVTGLLAVILLLVAVITVLVMVVVITMRMIMLWLLVVLSPLPFVLTAFPAGQKYAQQWTQEFFKYVIVGPVLAFFLWLSLAVSSTGKLDGMINDNTVTSELSNENLQRGENFTEYTSQQRNTAVFTAIGNPDNFLAFLIGIGMLLGGLMITQQLGVAGGAFAGQMSNAVRQKGLSALLAPAKLGKWGAGQAWAGTKIAAKSPFQYIGRRVNEGISEGRISALWNPAAMVRGWQARRKELYEGSEQAATAGAQEWIEKKFTGTSMPRRSMLAHSEESKFAKEFSFMNKNEMAKTAIDLREAPDTAEVRSKRRALIRAAGEQGYIDDIMGTKEMIDHVKKSFNDAYNGTGQFAGDSDEVKEARRKYFDESDIKNRVDNGEWHGFDQVHMFLESFVGRDRNGKSNEDGLNTIDSLEEIGMRIGHAEYAGHASYDAKKGTMVMTTLQKGDFNAHQKAETEFNKLKGRNRIPTAPHALFNFNSDKKGNFFASLDRYSLSNMIMAFKGQGKNIAEHGQNRNLNVLFGGEMSGMIWSKDKSGKVETREVKDANGKKVGETKVVDLTRLSGEALKKQLETMAAFMSIADKDGVSAAWKKVGGDGETAHFKIKGENGEDEYIDHKTLMDRYPINETLSQLGSTEEEVAQSVDQSAGAGSNVPNEDEDEVWDNLPDEEKNSRFVNAMQEMNDERRAQGAAPVADRDEVIKYAKEKAYKETILRETADSAQNPEDFANLGNSISQALRDGLDSQGIINAVNGLERILNNLNSQINGLSEGRTKNSAESDFDKLSRSFGNFRSAAEVGNQNQVDTLLRAINKSVKDLAFKVKQEEGGNQAQDNRPDNT